MRWQPCEPVCAECGFGWACSRQAAIDLVAAGPDGAAGALAGVVDPMRRVGGRWSASMYVWHLVDVLRIGTERLLTLTHDPDRGITCWDENALARDRHYHELSPAVGLIALTSAARDWVTAALAAPASTRVRHPQFGMLGAAEVITRNAHEVHHHLWDIRRAQQPAPG
jgi:DinB superfamily